MNFSLIPRLFLLKNNKNIDFKISQNFASYCCSILKTKTQLLPTQLLTNGSYKIGNRIHTKVFSLNQKAEDINKISSLQIKKRPLRKRLTVTDQKHAAICTQWSVKALATAEEYDLERLIQSFLNDNLYVPKEITISSNTLQDVIHAVINPLEGNEESREIFFFREGAVVMWNLSDRESRNIIDMLKFYEENSYNSDLIDAESESMNYCYDDSGKKSYLKNGDIILSNTDSTLSKYTFSNAMAQSVKLGIWEASLLHYVNSIEFITEDLKLGRKIRLTRQEVLRKQGELFALRHLINLRSDLLDTPDIYWERDDLEQLYQTTCGYFSIAKRTRVMNEKLNHCLELIELLSTHLSDRHHIRLEWMIILLIMVEVGFELLHYIDRYLAKND